MVLNGAPVDDFELAEQHVDVAAVVGGEPRLDITDAGADAFRFEQPRAVLAGIGPRIAGLDGGGGGGGVNDEGLAEPLLPGGQRGVRGGRREHDLKPL